MRACNRRFRVTVLFSETVGFALPQMLHYVLRGKQKTITRVEGDLPMPSEFSRRQFLVGVGAVPAAATVEPFAMAAAASQRRPIGFSTLGCPSWTWKKVLDFAEEHG